MRWCVRRVDLWQEFRCPPRLLIFLSRIDSHLFRVLLLRRLRLPLPLSARQCRCGRPSTLLATTVLHVPEQGSWEAGLHSRERGSTNLPRGRGQSCGERNAPRLRFSRSKPSGPASLGDPRRWLAPLWGGGAQLAVDTTLVSPLDCDGSPHPGAANVDGAVLAVARREEGEDVPRTLRASQPSPSGRFWQERLAGAGQKRLEGFCLFWQRPRPGLNPQS